VTGCSSEKGDQKCFVQLALTMSASSSRSLGCFGGCFSGIGQRKQYTELLEPEKCLYMNFKLLNLDVVFPKLMRAKVRSAGRPDALVQLAGKGGKFMASKPKFWRIFSNKLADKLTSVMPALMQQKGLTFNLTKVHCGERGFIVLRAEVVDIDLVKLIETARGTEIAKKMRPLVGVARKMDDVDRRLVPTVQAHMMQTLEAEIPKMMRDKLGFELLMIMKTSALQADFFFDALTPDSFEAGFLILNGAEVFPKLAQQKAQQRAGHGNLFGHAAGMVASHVASKAPDAMLARVASKRLASFMPEYSARLGVTLTVTQGFISETGCGSIVLRCEVKDIDLAIFQEAGGTLPSGVDKDQQLLRLGRRGRQEVYSTVREELRTRVPDMLFNEKEGLRVSIVLRDLPQSGEPAEEMAIELSDDDNESNS